VGEVKDRLEQIIRQVADELGIKVLELFINPNHIHLLISAYPTLPVHKIVKCLNSLTVELYNPGGKLIDKIGV